MTPAITGISDAMSDVLALVRMHGEFVCVNEYSAPWSLSFTRPIAHFHIVERGSAWIIVDRAAPTRIETGDLAILPLGAGHVLSSDPDLEPTPIEVAIAKTAVREGTIYRMGGGGEQTHVVCGRFSFAGVLAPKLLAVLPPLLHIRAEAGHRLEWLRLTAHFLIEETRRPKPGSAVMVAHLLDVLFAQAVRVWGETNTTNLGWLSGLTDAQIGRALSAMHERPAHDWTVESLADLAGLSRAAFAARFTEAVGRPPLKYLASWRLDLAADHLRAGRSKISEIATLVGYGWRYYTSRSQPLDLGVAYERPRH